VSLVRKLLAGAGAGALSVTLLGMAAPATAQTAPPPSGSFANANGIIVDLTVLTAVPIPGALGNTPIDPNTFATSSQSCPPDAGKANTKSLLSVPAAPAATADVVRTSARATCTTTDAASTATAETVNPKLLFQTPTTPLITADAILAVANSDCTNPPNATGTQFVNLKVAGQAIPVNPPPNTRIDIPGVATVIVNEQHPTASGRGIVVNGLHIIGASPLLRGDLIISHAVSGVVCANGKGSDPGTLPPPDISFAKDANPSVANPGDTVTYTATVTNNSKTAACDVRRLIDHLDPVFDLVSTSGDFGATFVTPPPKRSDGGIDAIVVPNPAVTIAAGASKTQTFVVKVKPNTAPGTYSNNLEIFCIVNGDFASGPLAPVTVPAVITPVIETSPPATQPPAAPVATSRQLALTGGAPLVAGTALLLLLGGVAVRRMATR